MGLLSFIKYKRTPQIPQSTTSGVNKDIYTDWAAMAEEQGGFFSTLTMCKNLRGGGLTFRCKTKDLTKLLSISLAGKMQSYYFEIGKRYKIRLQFDNSIVLYTYMHAYKKRHAHILDITDEFIQNLSDSENLKVQYHADDGKKVTMKFSLKGSIPAINSTISRATEQKKAHRQKKDQESG